MLVYITARFHAEPFNRLTYSYGLALAVCELLRSELRACSDFELQEAARAWWPSHTD